MKNLFVIVFVTIAMFSCSDDLPIDGPSPKGGDLPIGPNDPVSNPNVIYYPINAENSCTTPQNHACGYGFFQDVEYDAGWKTGVLDAKFWYETLIDEASCSNIVYFKLKKMKDPFGNEDYQMVMSFSCINTSVLINHQNVKNYRNLLFSRRNESSYDKGKYDGFALYLTYDPLANN